MDLGRDENFKSGKVTRGECAAYLARAFDVAPDMRKATFTDIVHAAISEISALGIMGGYPDGSFGPKKNITFNEIAVMPKQVQEVINKQQK